MSHASHSHRRSSSAASGRRRCSSARRSSGAAVAKSAVKRVVTAVSRRSEERDPSVVGGRAEASYQEAIERLGRTRIQVHLARARLLYGEWLRRQGRRLDAREQLRAAHVVLEHIGAAAFAERAVRELRALGEAVRPRSVDAAPVLTAQEAQIAELAGQGRTNHDIASELYISPKTVEYHLRKVFVKLGIGSRRELRSALPSPGLATASG
jgi:DNA-binding CsgD family transcriptional regulator